MLKLDRSQVIETALTSCGLGIAAFDQSGSLQFFNKASADMLGIGTEEVAPEAWPEHYGIYLPDELDLITLPQSPVARALAGEEADNIEVLIQNQLGSVRSLWCAISLRPLRGDDNQINGAVLLLQNITERRELANEAARSNKALQQFATVAAHDLQEPLRSIAGFADMLAKYQSDSLDERSTRCMSKIKDGVTRMQTLISDLLSYSRIQTKPHVLRPVDSNETVKTCISSLNASIVKTGADVTCDSLPTVMADASQLSQLFQNLVGNAIKFCASARPPVVRISAERKGMNWLFAVEDNGIGIQPEFRERIFGVFQRLHTRAAYPGTGIGLAICHTIVNRHGGRMWVEPKQGDGSIFMFTIPATPGVGP